MRTVIAVESCWKNRDCHAEIRQTWGKHAEFADLIFFLGNPQPPFSDKGLLGDEVWLPVNDDYDHLCEKTHSIVSYAYRNGYQGMFKVDTDSFLIGERLQEFIESTKNDYVGCALPSYPPCNDSFYYAHGGAGYWLSRESMKVIFNTSADQFCNLGGKLLAEDLSVGQALYGSGISLVNDARFSGYMRTYPMINNDVITTHQVSKDQIKSIEQYFYGNVRGKLHISHGTLIEPGKNYVVRDKKVYEVDTKGNIIQ